MERLRKLRERASRSRRGVACRHMQRANLREQQRFVDLVAGQRSGMSNGDLIEAEQHEGQEALNSNECERFSGRPTFVNGRLVKVG